MALHAYLAEGVDSAVIECGIGGEFDTTNILSKPKVAAVTSLGIDHTIMLGSTLPEIAWHKAGIFKEGRRAEIVPSDCICYPWFIVEHKQLDQRKAEE